MTTEPAPGQQERGGMGALSDISVDRPIFALMMSLAIVVLGALNYGRLGVDLLPAVELPQVTVFTTLRGAGPEEIESAITQPIEEQLNTIAGIEEMRSVNREGFSFIFLTFTLDRPIDQAVQDVRDKLARVVRVLPEGTDPPVISTFDTESTPVMAVAIAGTQSVRELTEFAETRAKDVLSTAPGVGQVTVDGGLRRAINVIVDVDKLAANKLSVMELERAIQAQNVETPGGRVTRDGREDIVRTLARVRSAEELGALVVQRRGDAFTRVSDVAEVEDGTVEARSAARLNGRTAVTLTIQKQAGANIVSTAAAVRERLKTLEGVLPAGAEMLVLRDSAVFVQESVHEARFHLVAGGLLAALAVLLFMGSIRSTLIAAVAIPASVLATFTVMRALDFTLNNITLLALTLAVGVVIDDAIVVVENIHRHIHDQGKTPLAAAKSGVREIALAISATTLSLVVIFLPVAFMTGQIGRLFNSYGVTVTVSILASLFIALTLTPMMASRLLVARRGGHGSALERGADRLQGVLDRAYVRLVSMALDHRAAVIALSVAITLTAIPLYRATPADLMPEDDQSEFEVSVELPTGTSFAAADTAVRAIEQQIAQLDGVRDVLTTVGDARGTGSATRATIYVGLVAIKERAFSQQAVMQKARGILQRTPDLRTTVRALNTANLGGGGYGGKLRLALRGSDLAKLDEILATLLRELRQEPAVVDVASPSADRLPELRVTPDRQKAADLGISPAEIADSVRVLIGGDIVSSLREGDERYDIVVRGRLQDRNSKEAVARLPMRTGAGDVVALENIAQIDEAQGATLILRLNGLRQVFLSANPAPGVSLSDAVAKVQAVVDRANLPVGYDAIFTGDVTTLEQTRSQFLAALLLSLVFVYMVLAAQFESLLHPITILLALPLIAPFALLSLLLLGETLNVYSIFGMFMLFGIVKKNGILQVDTTNQLLRAGMPIRAAILEANRLRLRPILMTTLTLVAAMAPMTFAKGPGAASRAALARVVVGGQALSLLITLLIVPVAYSVFHELGQRFRARTQRANPIAPAE